MAIGAFFILILVLIVVAVLGGGVYLIAMWLRHQQLDPDAEVPHTNSDPEPEPRPEHVRMDTEQKVRFVGTK